MPRLLLSTLFAFAVVAASPVHAQETRIAPKEQPSPPATLADVAWLVGQWSGEGIAGNEAHESWLMPSGNTMVGTFVQEDADGGIMFTEHMYLTESDGSLEVRLKHFNADLTGWEDKEGMLRFRLIGLEPCAAYFQGLTYRCADPEDGGESGIVIAVRMKSDGPEVKELVFALDRLDKAGSVSRCPDAKTTVDIDQCFAETFQRSDVRRAEYLAAALDRQKDRPELASLIEKGEAAFRAYRDAECAAVLEDWMDGTIRGVMTLSCKIEMTDQRTHTIWQNWLTYMDSTPPILPEPGPTQ